MWEKIKRDFRERLWNFGVLRGLYLIWFGWILHLDAIALQQGIFLDVANSIGWWPVFGQEYVIPHIANYVGFWSIVEGLRQALANSVKIKVEFNQLVEARKQIIKVEDTPKVDLEMS